MSERTGAAEAVSGNAQPVEILSALAPVSASLIGISFLLAGNGL